MYGNWVRGLSGCVVYWGAQGTGVHENGVHDVSGCTGVKGAWEWGARLSGYAEHQGAWEWGSRCVGVHRAPGCMGMGCAVYRGVREIRVHGKSVHNVLGCTGHKGAWEWGAQLSGYAEYQGAWEWGAWCIGVTGVGGAWEWGP